MRLAVPELQEVLPQLTPVAEGAAVELVIQVANITCRLEVDRDGQLRNSTSMVETTARKYSADGESQAKLDGMKAVLSAEEVDTSSFVTIAAALEASGLPVVLDLNIYVDKRPSSMPQNHFVFLTFESFERTFTINFARMADFEALWRPVLELRTTIWVLDLDEEYHTVSFSVVGPNSPTPSSELAEANLHQVGEILAFCKREVNWHARPRCLTPLCFQHTSGYSDAADGLMALWRARLAVFFLPSIAFCEGDRVVFHFAGEEIVVTSSDLEENLPSEAENIYNLFKWGYDGFLRERLQIIQKLIPGNISKDTNFLRGLAYGAFLIQEKANIAHRDHRIEKMESYFKSKKDLDQATANYVSDARSGILAMVKDTSDSLYRTVGVVLVTGILAIFKESNKALDAGFTVFLWIIGLGILCYLLFAIYHIFTIAEVGESKASDAKRRVLAAQLSEEHSRELYKEIDSGHSMFQKHARRVVDVYVTIVGVLTLLLIVASVIFR